MDSGILKTPPSLLQSVISISLPKRPQVPTLRNTPEQNILDQRDIRGKRGHSPQILRCFNQSVWMSINS